MTQSQMDRASSHEGAGGVFTQKDHPHYLQEMVKTCAEAILIEVISEETDPPETNIREALNKE